MKVLVPIDVWQGNESLVQDLSRMLPLGQCNLILVYSIQTQPHMDKFTGSGGIDYLYQELERKAKEFLTGLAAQLKPLCAGVEICFEHGQPATVIENTAKSKQVDLTVIRGSAAGLLESTFLGNTVSQVTKHSPNSVLVLRSGAILNPLNKVLVALDGSQSAKDALRAFCKTYKALANNIELVLAHVVFIAAPWRYITPVEFIATLEDNLDMEAKAILAEGEAILVESGWTPQTNSAGMVVRSGDPASELDRLASEINAGLIVVGAQGKTAVKHFLLGSVSEALALKSVSPILVFK